MLAINRPLERRYHFCHTLHALSRIYRCESSKSKALDSINGVNRSTAFRQKTKMHPKGKSHPAMYSNKITFATKPQEPLLLSKEKWSLMIAQSRQSSKMKASDLPTWAEMPPVKDMP